MLTLFEPRIELIKETDKFDLYAEPGDPVGYRHMCPRATKEIFNLSKDLAKLQSVKVSLSGTVVRDT